MRAQTVQTTVMVLAGHYRGNGLPRSIPMLFLVSKSGVAVEGGRVGVQRSAESAHWCHLHPVRRAVEGGSKQEASGVFGSRWRRPPTLLHRVLSRASACSVCYTSSCRGVHYYSASGKLRRASASSSCRGMRYSGSYSVYGTTSYREVHRSSRKLRRASVYSFCHTSSCCGFHFSSASGKLRRVLSWNTFLQILRCMPHQVLSWSTSLKRQRQATPCQRLQCLPFQLLSCSNSFLQLL